jgi:hypothetical protein
MPDATFRDLVLDATDAATLSDFWAHILGRTQDGAGGADRVVEPSAGGPAGERIWVNQVAHPRSGKARVHLDIRMPAADPTVMLAAGASLLREPAGEQHWWVLADPEGNEFCAMPPAPPEWHADVDRPTPFELVVDAADPGTIATWWAERVGGEATVEAGFAYVRGAVGFPWYAWVFPAVPEPKAGKNRWHWDVDLVSADPSAFLDAGARVLTEPGEDRWWVLADPVGNEFCAFPPAADG